MSTRRTYAAIAATAMNPAGAAATTENFEFTGAADGGGNGAPDPGGGGGASDVRQRPDGLHRSVACLGHSSGASGLGGSSGSEGVGGVVLADPAAFGPIGPIDFNDGVAVGEEFDA